MKTFIRCSGLAMIAAGLLSSALAQSDYVMHEWGTFTSVQGGDGELLPWRPLQTSELPGFVYNWSKAGLNRLPGGTMLRGKGSMVTLQRMETPVIYFYSSKEMSADVSVGFPKGVITEWYPQATQIGPARSANTNAASGALADSRAVWKNLRLSPLKTSGGLVAGLPQDQSGSHYFAARETGADFVQTTFAGPTNPVTETDKFIFYRGAGSFKTPLRVSADAQDAVMVENTGAAELAHLFLVSVREDGHGKSAAFTAIRKLPAKHTTALPPLNPADFQALETFQAEISAQMQAALRDEGLFPDEARAMVNTWKDSWFAEPGDRVFYILPRAWTDETLPMILNPQPERLVRVMVGRAEIITPKTVAELSGNLTKAASGDAGGRKLAAQEIKALGRFGEPALRLANRIHAGSTNAVELSYQLLFETARSNFE